MVPAPTYGTTVSSPSSRLCAQMASMHTWWQAFPSGKKGSRFCLCRWHRFVCVWSHIMSTTITTSIQDLVNHWEGLLCATRGMLVPTKCFWYLIDCKFVNNNWKYVSTKEQPGEIKICSDQQQWVSILRLKLDNAQWILGVQLAPNGNWESECQYLHLIQ